MYIILTVSQFFQEESAQAIFLVKKLVESGCDLNVPNAEGARPLYQCACGGSYGIRVRKYLYKKYLILRPKHLELKYCNVPQFNDSVYLL